MKREDLAALRVPLAVLGTTLLAAILLIYVSGTLLDRANLTRTQREAQLREARLRIQNAGEEKEMIARYLGPYQNLAREGFVGEEQRINWLDSLRLANEEARIFGVEYDIGTQRPYAYAAEFSIGQLVLQESLMNLRFRMLHEEDLPRFFSALRRHAGGYFTLEQCQIRRLTGGDAQQHAQVQPHLAADCEVRWLTVKPPSAQERKG